MKRYVVISHNDNPDYEFYIPIVKWAWQVCGWGVLAIKPFPLPPYDEVTITQCVRLYAGILKAIEKDDILMTSDADMIPLADYWQPKMYDITTYGKDLTDYHFPMCYIAMTKRKWGQVMNLNSKDIKELMSRDLKDTSALSEDPTKKWVVDQDIITERLKNFDRIDISRGTDRKTSYPLGRVDRSTNCKIPEGPLIDFHAPRKGWEHGETIKNVLKLAFGSYPEEINDHIEDYKNKAVEA